MTLFLTILHLALCVALIFVILLQPGKGGDVAAAFGAGGGSSTVFGPRGAGSFLSNATTIFAGLFMFTSISLALLSTEDGAKGELEDGVQLEEEEGQGFGNSKPKELELPPLPGTLPTELPAIPLPTEPPAGEVPQGAETSPAGAPAPAEPAAPAAPAPAPAGTPSP